MRKPKTHLEFLDYLPPCICRLLARENYRALSTDRIAEKMGVNRKTVLRLSKLQTWKDVPVVLVDKFREACGITYANEKRQWSYLRTTVKFDRPLAHLQHLSTNERRMIQRQLDLYMKMQPYET